MKRLRTIMALAVALIGSAVTAQGPVPGPGAPLTPEPAATAPQVPVRGGGVHPLTPQDLSGWLDGYMPFALRSGDLAGAVVTVVQDGRVIAAKGYGYADIAKRRPVDPATTLFRPGSVSKLITWTAVMQQVEQGRIDLDRDINTYLDFRIPPRNGQPVTMRQVMTHTAGFEEAVKDLITYDQKGLIPLGTYLKRWVPTRIFDAGKTPAYSNWATSLAGYVVERVSGMPFDDYVERRVFAPIGMRTASFRQPLPARLQPLMATGYPRASEPAEGFEIVVPAPAGSMSASGLDMAKFMVAHLNQGRGLMRPETAAAMHDSSLARVDPMSLIPPLNRMELGFFETDINGRSVIAHLGDTENFHTSLHLFMNERTGLYVSFNSAGKEGAAHTVRSQLFQDFADRYFPGPAPTGRVDAETAKRHAQMMVGLWEGSRHSQSNFVDILNLVGQTAVSLDDKGGLVIADLKGPSGEVRKWDEIAPFVWRDRNGHDRLAAKVVDGRVVRWSFDMVSPFTVFDPVPAHRALSWLKPALIAALAVLLLTFLYWPGAVFVRWRFKAAPSVSGPALRTYRATRLMALLTLVMLGGWAWFITSAFSDLDKLSSKANGTLWFLQIASALVFVGAVGVAAWNVWLTWTDGRKWTRKLWSLLVLLAALLVLYVAATFHLLAMTVNY
jgi:CubicO group peptidase (beta-lactamase class C family)